MNLTNFFGINVDQQFSEWFHFEFVPLFEKKYGPNKHITLLVLDPDLRGQARMNWENPRYTLMINEHIGASKYSTVHDGTLANVIGKLQWVLREDSNSVEGETNLDKARPGDFLWEGAGTYRGYTGGVSGLKKEEDWEVFCKCIDKLIELTWPIGATVKAKSDLMRKQLECPEGVKYLRNITVTESEVDQFIEELEAWRQAESRVGNDI